MSNSIAQGPPPQKKIDQLLAMYNQGYHKKAIILAEKLVKKVLSEGSVKVHLRLRPNFKGK